MRTSGANRCEGDDVYVQITISNAVDSNKNAAILEANPALGWGNPHLTGSQNELLELPVKF